MLAIRKKQSRQHPHALRERQRRLSAIQASQFGFIKTPDRRVHAVAGVEIALALALHDVQQALGRSKAKSRLSYSGVCGEP